MSKIVLLGSIFFNPVPSIKPVIRSEITGLIWLFYRPISGTFSFVGLVRFISPILASTLVPCIIIVYQIVDHGHFFSVRVVTIPSSFEAFARNSPRVYRPPDPWSAAMCGWRPDSKTPDLGPLPPVWLLPRTPKGRLRPYLVGRKMRKPEEFRTVTSRGRTTNDRLTISSYPYTLCFNCLVQ